jgi:hypothetical protein
MANTEQAKGAKDGKAPAWTPGPWNHWKTRPSSVGQFARNEAVVCVGHAGNSGNCIAIVHMGGPGAISNERSAVEANARLIASAPSMYDALHNIATMPLPEQDNMVSRSMRNIARAALSLAGGEK